MIQLKSISDTPLRELQQLADNKAIADNLKDGFPHPYTVKHGKDFLRFAKNKQLGDVFGVFAGSQFVGIGGILPKSDIYRNTGEIGYWIGEPFWGKGYGKDLVKKLTDHAFENMRLIRVFAGIFPHNRASMRILEHAGYRLEVIAKAAIVKNGMVMDEHVYSIVNPDNIPYIRTAD